MSKELEALEIECGELVEMDLLFLDRNGENQEKWHNSEAFKKAVEFEKKYGKSHIYILKSALQRLEAIDKKRCGANVEKVIIDEFVPGNDLEKEYLEDLDHYDEGMGIHSTSYEKCKERLIRLAKIDSANPSEALIYLDQFMNEMTRCLENPKQYAKNYNKEIFWKYKNTFETTIKQALLKAQEQDFNYNKIVIPFFDELVKLLGINDTDEMLDKIKEQEKENVELKRVLETIKEKSDLSALEMANNVDEFNEMTFHKKPYTEEEFDLLKRYLNDK